MQILIFLALLVIIVLLAPWMLGVLAAVFVAGGAAFAVVFVIGAVILALGVAWITYFSNPARQQARLERRIKKITDAANRANSRND